MLTADLKNNETGQFWTQNLVHQANSTERESTSLCLLRV